jgi:hypothetical protein
LSRRINPPGDAPFPERMQRTMALSWLLRGVTQTEAARRVGVIPNTITMWMKDEDFLEALEEGRRDVLEGARRVMIGAAVDVTTLLLEVALGEKQAGRVQMDAMREILDRTCGKPTQRVEASIDHRYEHMTLYQLQAKALELAALAEEHAKLEEKNAA